MFGRLLHHRDDPLLDAGERARRAHERWLNRALANPRWALPTIPLRRVADGGFSSLTVSPQGRAWADLWWESALVRVETDG